MVLPMSSAGRVGLLAEAIRTTGVIGLTVVRIANATDIGYRHDGSIRFSNKLTQVLNY